MGLEILTVKSFPGRHKNGAPILSLATDLSVLQPGMIVSGVGDGRRLRL